MNGCDEAAKPVLAGVVLHRRQHRPQSPRPVVGMDADLDGGDRVGLLATEAGA